MAGSIKGIIVEIGGDTSGLQKALSKVKNTDTFQKVIDEISEDFSTNLSMNAIRELFLVKN